MALAPRGSSVAPKKEGERKGRWGKGRKRRRRGGGGKGEEKKEKRKRNERGAQEWREGEYFDTTIKW